MVDPNTPEGAPATPAAPVPPAAPAAPVPPAAPVSPVAPAVAAAPKNPIVSGIISLIIPGAGQIINGQVKKGIALLAAWILSWILIVVLSVVGGTILTAFTGVGGLCCCFTYFLPLLVNLYAAYDAYKTAQDMNNGIIQNDWFS